MPRPPCKSWLQQGSIRAGVGVASTTGRVYFLANGVAFGSGPLAASRLARLATSALLSGTPPLRAVCAGGGDDTYAL
jgi:hypothetical protein